jgi:ribosome biogenesis GTPase
MFGRVIRSTGSSSTVRSDDGRLLECKFRGIMRTRGLRTTNPVAVGDKVELEDAGNGEYFISEVQPRENYLIRRSVNLSKEAHVLAANIDKAYVIVTLKSPRTSYGFIDRILLTCEAYHIPAMLVVNKADLIKTDADFDQLAGLIQTYTGAGYEVLVVSVLEKRNLDLLHAEMDGKVNLFSGHSGTGKTSIINSLNPNISLRVGEISEAHQKGKHTTTFAELVEIWENTYVIDTPGVKEFGIVDMEKSEIGTYFPDIRKFALHCRFSNCLHQNEPNCAVKEAVEKGDLDAGRYHSYLGILESEELASEFD